MPKKTIIYCLTVMLSFCLVTDVCLAQNFYHGKKSPKKTFHWNQKSTKHFEVMYNDKYFDPERVLEMLSEKFNIPLIIAGVKIKLFIDEGQAYTIVGAKTIYAGDEVALAHELAHVLFLQLNRNAPLSIREGIAIYAELPAQPYLPRVDVKEIIALESNFNRVSKKSTASNVYARQNQRSRESQLFAKGLCFVANIIRDKGIDAFKEFYKRCSNIQAIQTAWDRVYSQ